MNTCPDCGAVIVDDRARFCNGCGARLDGATELLPVIGPDDPVDDATGEIPLPDPDAATETIGLGIHLEELAIERRRETAETQQFERTMGIPADEMQLIIRPVEWADDPADDDATPLSGWGPDPTAATTAMPTLAGSASGSESASVSPAAPMSATDPIGAGGRDDVDDTPVQGITLSAGQRERLSATSEETVVVASVDASADDTARGARRDELAPTSTTTSTSTPTRSAPASTSPTTSWPGPRFSALSLIAIVQTVVLLVAMTVDVVAISTTAGEELAPIATSLGMRVGVWHVEHLGSNLAIAGLISAIGLAIGAVASIRRLVWGPGLIGGSALASTGVAALAIGLAEYPADAARAFAATATTEAFTVTIVRSLGYWSLLAAAAIGIIGFFGAVNEMFVDRETDLNPWVGALGAMAVLLAALAPLVPVGDATWSANWVIGSDPGSWPAELVVARLVQSGMVVVGGVFGFLIVRRFGLGMIAGAVSPGVWLALSAWIGLGSSPVGPAIRNPGATGTGVGTLTVAGYVTVAAVLAAAGAIAWDHEQHRT